MRLWDDDEDDEDDDDDVIFLRLRMVEDVDGVDDDDGEGRGRSRSERIETRRRRLDAAIRARLPLLVAPPTSACLLLPKLVEAEDETATRDAKENDDGRMLPTMTKTTTAMKTESGVDERQRVKPASMDDVVRDVERALGNRPGMETFATRSARRLTNVVKDPSHRAEQRRENAQARIHELHAAVLEDVERSGDANDDLVNAWADLLTRCEDEDVEAEFRALSARCAEAADTRAAVPDELSRYLIADSHESYRRDIASHGAEIVELTNTLKLERRADAQTRREIASDATATAKRRSVRARVQRADAVDITCDSIQRQHEALVDAREAEQDAFRDVVFRTTRDQATESATERRRLHAESNERLLRLHAARAHRLYVSEKAREAVRERIADKTSRTNRERALRRAAQFAFAALGEERAQCRREELECQGRLRALRDRVDARQGKLKHLVVDSTVTSRSEGGVARLKLQRLRTLARRVVGAELLLASSNSTTTITC